MIPSSSFLAKKLPSPALATVVDEFILRKIYLEPGQVIRKLMPSRPVNSIDFFLAGSYRTVALETQALVPFVRCTIRGPRTFKKYRIEIDENFVCFSIRFKPTGIFQLLGIPMPAFCNESVDGSAVLPVLFHGLTEQLLACHTLDECVAIAEPALLKQIALQNRRDSAAGHLATFIKEHANVRMQELYQRLPVSSRHQERMFVNEVGVSPKAYSNLLRFDKVVRDHMCRPHDHWSSIASELNYFDQMHLVKDFKKFLGITPTAFRVSDFAY